MVFTIAVFVLLWIFQILFLERFYESMKTRDAGECLEEISESYEKMEPTQFSKYIDDMAVRHDICIEVLDRYRRSIYSSDVIGDCLIHGRENKTQVYIISLLEKANKKIRYKIKNSRSNCDMLVFGCTLGDPDNPEGYLLLNSALVPVGATVSIIKRQLMITTSFLVVLAFMISLYLSKRIARPITNITKAAENLAHGDFRTHFDGEDILNRKSLPIP